MFAVRFDNKIKPLYPVSSLLSIVSININCYLFMIQYTGFTKVNLFNPLSSWKQFKTVGTLLNRE